MASSSQFLDRHQVAAHLDESKDAILKEWQTRCRQKVEAARAQTRLALIDSLPQFLDQLVVTLQSSNPKSNVKENAEVAREHAEDRANQPEYTLDQVIAEYHILRNILIESVDAKGITDTESRKMMHEFIDLGISKASVTYLEYETHRQSVQTAEIEATRFEAERASQAKSAFLANMSHEIRTPLGAIMGFVGLLKELGLDPNSEAANYLSIIDRNSHHLLRIIDDILDLTKVEAGKMVIEKSKFQLVQFLADFAATAGARARESGLIFEFKCDGPLPEFVETDPSRLRQILFNVVGNAIKFTEKGRVVLTADYNTYRLGFRVTDTGRGISPEQRDSLFQAFSQADSSSTRKFGGTGLGLILTKKLCQALGGDFRLVESEIGSGSVFDIQIPVATPEEVNLVSLKSITIEPSQNSKQAQSQKILAGLEILVVEDSPDNQYLIEKMLEETGSSLTFADNGAKGVELALTGKFNVILMDIQMPVMDGHEAVRELRAKGYAEPVIALTAHAMKEEAERASKSGFTHFLTKPINKKILVELLEQLHRPLDIRL